jgi:hypothetical protein
MNVSAIQSTALAAVPQPARVPAKTTAPAAKPAPVATATPAATVSLTSGVPASVKAEDRAAYQQFLRSMGGNQMAALAALRAQEAAEGE